MRKRRVYKKPVKKLTVVFCVPGNKFTNNFLISWTNLVQWCLNNNIEPLLINDYDAVVYYARNKCLGGNTLKGVHQKPFQGKLDYDYLMWIDSDMVFEPSDFKALLEMDKPICSGVYKMRDNIHYATVVSMIDKEFLIKGSYSFLNDKTLKAMPEQFMVDYTGFGWVLFKKGILEKLEYPWFRPIWHTFKQNVEEFTSEDVGICKQLKKKGYRIYVNKNLIIGHEKSCILR